MYIIICIDTLLLSKATFRLGSIFGFQPKTSLRVHPKWA